MKIMAFRIACVRFLAFAPLEIDGPIHFGQNGLFGPGEFGNLTNFAQGNYNDLFLDRDTVFRINWKQIVAFVPITNDGNIYFGKKITFSDIDNCNTGTIMDPQLHPRNRFRSVFPFCGTILRIAG